MPLPVFGSAHQLVDPGERLASMPDGLFQKVCHAHTFVLIRRQLKVLALCPSYPNYRMLVYKAKSLHFSILVGSFDFKC